LDPKLRQLARERARHRCEYRRLRVVDEPNAPFHVEHIVARQHCGPSIEANLAFACMHCNLHKGTNLFGLDPDTNAPVGLFHPRQDCWDGHFKREGAHILGVTDVGRTTAWLLQFNNDLSVLQRLSIIERRHHLDDDD
jgi:hypothetical protein